MSSVPDIKKPTGLEFNGVPVMNFPVKDDPLTHSKKIYELPMREDDIFITAFPKCGTHWVSEILHMLTTGATEFCNRVKEFVMLEFCDDLPFLATLPSPRVLNSHLYMAQLPREIVDKKVKMVHMIRNPRDVVVSAYHHFKHMKDQSFEEFLKNFISGNKYGGHTPNQFNYLRQMAEFEKTHPDQPIMHIHFEDLKQDPAAVIKKLSQFIGTEASDEFCQTVASACGFANMKKADESRELPQVVNDMFNGSLKIYRKGAVGDWKNFFTVAQSEMFDQFVAEQKKQGLGYIPRGEF
ncbi:hypothetical protein EGW08_006003 [Elysia chlorotica]|uniref:Sulfotransferase domain-containing protein n=1 Tax=Elysia chlorotica TaxID=188477 RepID=A0A3S1HU67_ELYCH|nr:hypothetical protein EGW08_006003 [Elysia chlorotica]